MFGVFAVLFVDKFERMDAGSKFSDGAAIDSEVLSRLMSRFLVDDSLYGARILLLLDFAMTLGIEKRDLTSLHDDDQNLLCNAMMRKRIVVVAMCFSAF